MYSRFSRYFTIIRSHEDFAEFKSRYHYWRIIYAGNGQYFLDHKYTEKDKYHRQFRCPCMPGRIIRYVLAHDSYMDSIY